MVLYFLVRKLLCCTIVAHEKKERKIMLKKSLLILGLASCFALPALAADWVQVSHNKYVDASSIKPSNAYGTFTFKAKAVADRVPFETHEKEDVWQVNGSMYINCRTGYLREVSYSMYDSDNKLIHSNKASGNEWKNIGPNSPVHNIYEYVCRASERYDWRRYDLPPHNYYYKWWY